MFHYFEWLNNLYILYSSYIIEHKWPNPLSTAVGVLFTNAN